MAKTSAPSPEKGKPRPESPTKPAPAPRVISRQVFNDFAAI